MCGPFMIIKSLPIWNCSQVQGAGGFSNGNIPCILLVETLLQVNVDKTPFIQTDIRIQSMKCVFWNCQHLPIYQVWISMICCTFTATWFPVATVVIPSKILWKTRQTQSKYKDSFLNPLIQNHRYVYVTKIN